MCGFDNRHTGCGQRWDNRSSGGVGREAGAVSDGADGFLSSLLFVFASWRRLGRRRDGVETSRAQLERMHDLSHGKEVYKCAAINGQKEQKISAYSILRDQRSQTRVLYVLLDRHRQVEYGL